MFVSWELLKDFIDVGVSPEEAAERLTLSGAEVEGLRHTAGAMRGVVTARIASLEKHPTQDRLAVARLDAGDGRQSLCITSAVNMKPGDLVFYAPPGSVLPDGTELGTVRSDMCISFILDF